MTALIQRILEREGGIKDVGDGKGLTMFGQTPAWLHAFHLPAPETVEDAALNYEQWLKITGLHTLCDPEDVLTDIVVDWAVHSGHETAIRAMQRELEVVADGYIGPVTLHALAYADRRHLAAKILAARFRFLGKLLSASSTTCRFASGWMNRLAPQILALTGDDF